MTAAFGDDPFPLAAALDVAAGVPREPDDRGEAADRARVEPLRLFGEPLPLFAEPLPLFRLEPFELREVVFRLLEEVLASAIAPP